MTDFATTSTKTIVIDDAVPYAEAIFSHLGKIITMPGKSIDADAVKNADALIIRSRTQINEQLLRGSKVKYVGSTVVGLDHVDQDYLKQQGIHFYSAQGCNANSVAEFVLTALYHLAQQHQFDLTSKTLGIIGVGNVGKRLYNKAKKLGIKCLLNDPPKVEQNPELTAKDPYVDLDTCLTADIITVQTPLIFGGKHPTHHLISEQKLASIKPQQIIINAARGGIINEQAWINTKTFANIIDCWENEPNINQQLYDTACLATPHIAGHSLDAKVAGSSMVYDDLCKFWGVKPDDSWQKALPEPPPAIELSKSNSAQTILNNVFEQTHNIVNDDLAIRDDNFQLTQKKYEDYRRNFPIYREWHRHKLITTIHSKAVKQLNSLGFKSNK